VIYLGPNLPAGEIVNAVRRVGPDALVLGIAGTEAMPKLLQEIRQVAQRLPTRTELWLGGKEAARAQTVMAGRPTVLLTDFTSYERQLKRIGAAV
jgi:hypothetical protein